ncbi:MAG: ribonuclease HI [Sandaracinaceae bacterium]|nr:ribonuclease HI [Sandaracinaceae bacterium]
MPWIVRSLRGQKVLARCEEDGTLRAEEGRVEIRYKPNDGKAYRANAANLAPSGDATILPDAHCAPALDAPKKEATSTSGAATTSKPAAKKSGKAKSEHASSDPHTAEGDTLTVYADGACSGNPGPAGLGVVIYEASGKRELSEYLGRATNNIAELTAILRAAEALVDESRPIVLKTDSQYSIGVLTKGWKAKANPDLIADVKAALAKVPHMKIRYVEGHAGHSGNERADELARAAVSTQKNAGWKTYKKAAD